MTKQIVFSEKDIKEICNLYIIGLPPNKIANRFNVSCTPMLRILKENSIKSRNYSESCKINFCIEHEKEICELYKNGMSGLKILKIFNISGKKLKRCLIKNNIRIRGRSESAKIYIGKRRREISKEIQKQICIMYNDNLSCNFISNKFNITKSHIKLILNNNNIKIRYVKKSIITREIEKRTCELYKNKMKFKEISDIFNISVLSVKKILIKNNIKFRNTSEACMGRNAWNKKEISNEIKNEICNKYKDGKVISNLCKEYNICCVRNILKEGNIKIRTNSDYKSGEKSIFWQGGKSFGIYCPKFNENKREEIRNKYNRCCIICNKSESENLTKKGKNKGKFKKLHVHHIDYNKDQGCKNHEWRLAPLCNSCHAKTGHKRIFWESKIKEILSEIDIKNNILKFFQNLFIV